MLALKRSNEPGDYDSANMIVSMENETFRQPKSSDDRRDSGIDPQMFAESLPTSLCSPLEKQLNCDTLNLSQSSYLSDISLETEKVDSIPSVKEMVRQREMMALKPNKPTSQILPVKASSQVERPEVKVKLIVQRFESGLQDDGKSVSSNPHTLPKSEDKKTRSCSKLPSFLKHSLSYMNDSNTSHSDSCPSFMNSLANNATGLSDSAYQYSASRQQMIAARRYANNPVLTNECQASKCNSLPTGSASLSAEKNSVNWNNRHKTPEKHSPKNLQDLTRHENLSACRVNSKISSDTLSTENSGAEYLTDDNSMNEIFQIDVSEDSKSNLNVRMCQDSSNFSDRANNTWTFPKKGKESKIDDLNTSHGTSLYRLVKSLREVDDIPTKMRSTTDFARNVNGSGSQASSSPSKTRPSIDSLSSICQNQYSTVSEETVSIKWILDKLRLSCPDLDIYYDPNEICTISKLQEIFDDLKNLFSSKKDSDKNMISLFRENRSSMRLIRKQAKDLEDRYNLLQWKSVYTHRRVSELTNRHQEAMELEDILNVRLANIQDELPDGVWLPPTQSLTGMLEAVLEGESLLLANKYKKVINNLQKRLQHNQAEEMNKQNQFDMSTSFLQCQSHNLDQMSDDFLREKEELLLLKEEISTLYTEIKKLTAERNHLLIANKTLHHELQQSHNKIAHFEQDICSHICQHKKLKPHNARDCNNPRHFLDIQELRTQLQEQRHKIEQQNKIVDLLGSLINATREVLHQQEYETQNIPGVCKLLKMIEGEINPSSVVLEASATPPWF